MDKDMKTSENKKGVDIAEGEKEKPKSERTENLVAIVIFLLLIIIGAGIFTKGFGLFEKNQEYSNDARINVPLGNDPHSGNPNASIIIVAFSDYECPFCKKAEGVMKSLLTKYKDEVVYVFRDFPLTRIHPHTYNASLAAECAKEQNKYWEYHNYLFENNDKLEPRYLEEYARLLGLDEERFRLCFESKKYDKEIEKDISTGKQIGVTSTPTFFINGIKVVGAQPEEVFTDIIDSELGK